MSGLLSLLLAELLRLSCVSEDPMVVQGLPHHFGARQGLLPWLFNSLLSLEKWLLLLL